MKTIERVVKSPAQHWVGDGFPVRSILSPDTVGDRLSPFLLLDHAGPEAFPPSDERLGVDFHPHRGFEAVTVVFQGELEHRDTSGHGGTIGPGDVQWMTAASGLLHEEKHSRAFARKGGVLEMAQLWVNLPARHKMSKPGYQALLAGDIPTVSLGGGASARVISGELSGARGPARTFTPVLLWDVKAPKGASFELPIPESWNAGFLVRRGEALVAGSKAVKTGELAILGREGSVAAVKAASDLELLVLGGEAIPEPVAMYGPFVMNTETELRTAIEDYRAGRMGRVPSEA